MTRPFLLLLLTLLPVHTVLADYITDRLLVGLYADHDSSGKAIKVLSSGTEVAVLDRKQGYIKVKLKDGTVGWVELRYITQTVPAQERLEKLEEEHKKLQQELERTTKARNLEDRKGARGKLNKAYIRIAEQEKQVKQLKEQIAAMEERGISSKDTAEYQEEIGQLEAKLLQSQIKLAKRMKMDEGTVKAEMDAMRERMDKAIEILRDRTGDPNAQTGIDEGLPFWVYIMIFLTLITGVVAGFAVFEYRSRREGGQDYNIHYRL